MPRTPKPAKKAPVEFYVARDGWRWRAFARNRNRIVADGAEGYRRKVDAVKGARAALRALAEHFA